MPPGPEYQGFFQPADRAFDPPVGRDRRHRNAESQPCRSDSASYDGLIRAGAGTGCRRDRTRRTPISPPQVLSALWDVDVPSGQGGHVATTVHVPSAFRVFVTLVGGGMFVAYPLYTEFSCPSGMSVVVNVPQIIGLPHYGILRFAMACARSDSRLGSRSSVLYGTCASLGSCAYAFIQLVSFPSLTESGGFVWSPPG